MKTIPAMAPEFAAKFRRLILEARVGSDDSPLRFVNSMNDGSVFQLNVDFRSMDFLVTRNGAVAPLTFKDAKTGEVFTAIHPPRDFVGDSPNLLLQHARSLIDNATAQLEG